MFGSEEDLKNSIPNSMVISIIHPNPQKCDLTQRILEKTGYDFKERLKFTCTQNYKDIYKDLDSSNTEKEPSSSRGLINRKWIDDLCYRRPALIIYFYQIPNGADKSSEEKKIYEQLAEIRKLDDLVYIFLFIICKDMKENPYNFNSDDPQKSYNLRNIIQKEFLFEFPNDEIWRAIDLGNFSSNIIHYSRLYYRKYKNKIEEKKVKSTTREEKIECDIMLGVLSIIKTKKFLYNKNKYLDEAYELITDKTYDRAKYLYGNKSLNPKFNLIEVRAVSDWLFAKIMKLQNVKLPSSTTTPTSEGDSNSEKKFSKSSKTVPRSLTSSLFGKQENRVSIFDMQIERYKNHIKKFSLLYEYLKTDNKDKFIFIEYYWLIQRFKDLCELYEEHLKHSHSKKKIFSLGRIYLKQIYYYIKMAKFLSKSNIENINTISIKNKEVSISKIEIAINKYYGKPPNYSYKDIHNPLMKFELGFNEDIYFKKFIVDKKLNSDGNLIELYNQYLSKASNIFINLKKNLSNNSFDGGIDLYLNLLKMLLYNEKENNLYDISNLKINENLFKIINSFPNLNLNNIKKFPKIYFHYLELNVNSLISNFQNPDIDNLSKTKLFIYLSLLGNLRKLNENEENIFFQLINDEQFTPVYINETKTDEDKGQNSPIIIKLKTEKNRGDNIFDFEYELKNGEDSHEKKILDLVEYNFKIKTFLSKENIKLNSVKIFFQSINEDTNNINDKKQKREIIIREYNKEELNNFDLNKDSPILLEHKLFMKYKKGKIYLSHVEFTLCKKENIIYKIELQNDISKMIFITNLNKKVLNIKIPKEKLTVGVNQLNKFEIEVNKEDMDEVWVSQFKLNFISLPSYYKKTVPNTSMKALLNNKAMPSRTISNLPSNQTNINQQIFGLPKNDSTQKKVSQTQNRQMSLMPPNPKSNTKISQGGVAQSSMQNFFYKTPNDKPVANQNTNSASKSQVFPSSTITVNPTPSTYIGSNLPSEKIQVTLPFPEFYNYNEENHSLDKSEKEFEIEYKDFESLLKSNKRKYGILIKFLQEGQYEIKLNISYSIRHKDIEDYFEFNQEQSLKFIVIEPFKFSNEINSNNFSHFTQIKEDKTEQKITKFLTNRNLQMNLILTNQLNEDIIIKDIIIQKDEEKLTEKNKNIEIKSSIKDIIDSAALPKEIKNQILKIIKTSDYSIPFETIFNDEFQGSLGKIILKWSTPSLIDYECGDLDLINENVFDFPYIIVSKSNLSYEYNTTISENKDVIYNIKVENISEKCIKIIFMIENGDDVNFIVSGMTKKIHSIKSKEILNVVFRLIPLIHNIELKLPKIKICEMNYTSQEKYCSNYYYPEKINII